MPDLTPMTRQEKFLNGDTDLEPITRREHFYAGREGELPEGSQDPQTREEWFIKKYRGGGGGDITVEEITITENGTTTAPSGKAYSPIHTNVPLPQNAYLLKSIANLPQAIASFSDGADAPMKSLKVAIEPQQDLHGYDAPWAGGAGKNKLKVTATTQEISGVTFTVNEDGTVKANGTATDAIMLVLNTTVFTLPSGNYKISAGVSGTSGTTYFVCSNYASGQRDYTNDGAFTSDGSLAYKPSIYIVQGVTLSNVVFKPMIRLASVQDDTFAPYENICPITGYTEANVTRTGKNLFDKTMTLENGYIDASGQVVIANQYKHTQLIKINPNTSYVGSGYLSSGSGYLTTVAYYDKNQNFISQATMAPSAPYSMTTPQNANYLILSGNNPQVDTIQLEEGQTATSYEPFGSTYTIDLDGTRYGGEVDVTSGVLTVDRIMFSLNGSENWATDIVGDNKRRFTCILLIDLGATTTTTFDAISNIYVNTKNPSYTNLSEVFILRYLSQYNQNRIDIMTEAYQNVASFKAFLNNTNMQICYELATPLTIQLTPTAIKSLRGVNNVYANTGDITDAEYFSKEV